jgi:hypothetical protein
MEPDGSSVLAQRAVADSLVGRAQWKINQPPSLKDNERAWKKHLYRSTRAFEDRPGYHVERDRNECGRAT